MNIHFEDKKLKNSLDKNTAVKIIVGSHIYGLNNEESDTDYLSIYLEPTLNAFSCMFQHHQLQYKEDQIDFNYTSLQKFIRNILTGDSTINFEALYSNEMKNSNLSFLYDNRKEFISYTVIKSYLGLAKRDLKFARMAKKNEKNKKLVHFIRGVIFAGNLLDGEDLIDLSKRNKFFDSDLELLKKLKEDSELDTTEIIEYYENYMKFLKDEMITAYSKGSIRNVIDPLAFYRINKQIIEVCLNAKGLDTLDYGMLFEEVLENDISY